MQTAQSAVHRAERVRASNIQRERERRGMGREGREKGENMGSNNIYGKPATGVQPVLRALLVPCTCYVGRYDACNQQPLLRHTRCLRTKKQFSRHPRGSRVRCPAMVQKNHWRFRRAEFVEASYRLFIKRTCKQEI